MVHEKRARREEVACSSRAFLGGAYHLSAKVVCYLAQEVLTYLITFDTREKNNRNCQ